MAFEHIDRDEKKKLFLKYFKESQGNTKYTLAKTHLNEKTYYNWRKNDPVFEAKLQTITKSLDDRVIKKFWDLIEDGDKQAIFRYLNKKRFKNTPYENVELLTDGNSIQLDNYTFSVQKINKQEDINTDTDTE